MSESSLRLGRAAKAVSCGCAVALTVLLASPATALADVVEELQAAQQQVEQSNEDYEAATQRLDEINAQIEETEARLEEIESELPAQREAAEESLRTLYKMQQGSGGLVEMLLNADDFYDLISTIRYLGIIQSKNTDALSELKALEDELEETRDELKAQQEEAAEQQQAAEEALASAEEARTALEEEIEAQAAAEEAERQAAIAAAEAAAAESTESATFTTESGNEAQIAVADSSSTESVDWSSDKETFISEWSARIDAFLAGSPLAGQGATFAEAAWEYGVDPRLSPAIAGIESSLGRYCFLPYNAWGWGSSSWSSWEEAIWAHVKGLAQGYGGQLTYAGAQKYCPNNADYWYSSVLSFMQQI